MKKIVYAFLALSLFAVFGCTGDTTTNSSSLTAPNANPFTPKGTVSGLLRDAVTNEALVGAKVSIMDRSATTNESGLFTITDVPALNGAGNESTNANSNYPVVIDMTAINKSIADYNAIATNTVKKAAYPSTAYANANVVYSSLGETGSTLNAAAATSTATNHDTPVDGFVANITPFVGKLDANVSVQVVDIDNQVVAGATVYLYYNSAGTPVSTDNSTGTNGAASTAAVDGGAAGHLISTQTSDANGIVTFSNIEAKRKYVVKGVKGNQQGALAALTAPADGLIDVYGLNQGAFASAVTQGNVANFFSNPLTLATADNIAPTIISASPINLSDIAIPATGNQDVIFTFSEPLKQSQYAKNITKDAAVNGGLYNDVIISYDGPKAGNIAHSLEWNTDFSVLTVHIPATALTAASRYSVDITRAINGAGAGGQLKDANLNNFAVFTGSAISFTTSGGFNVAAPVAAKTNAANSVAIEWATVVNAASYKVYVAKSGITPYAATGTAANGTTVFAVAGFPTFNIGSIPGISLANGVVYTVKVTAVNGSGSESDFSNEISFSEVAPAAPAAVARRAAAANVTQTNIDWTPSANVSGYNVYVERVVGGIGEGFGPATTVSLPTVNVAGQLVAGIGGSVYADGQNKVTYNVKVTALGLLGSESVASPVVVIDDKTTPTANRTGGTSPVAPIAANATSNGTVTVTFNKPMLYSDIINPASWTWTFAGATTNTVSQAFGSNSIAGAAPISLSANSTVATVPWSVATDATGSVAAGAVTLACTAKSIGGALAVTGSF